LDDSGFALALPLSEKGHAAAAIQEALLQLERQTGHLVKQLRSDMWAQSLPSMRSFCAERGIVHQTSVPYTPQQNGSAERLNRTLEERMRALLIESGLRHDLWPEALQTAAYIRNLSPVRDKAATPWELLFWNKPDVGHLRVFGSRCFVLIPEQQRPSDLDPVSAAGRLLGYPRHSKGYRVLLDDWRIVESRDILVNEEAVGVSATNTGTAVGAAGDCTAALPGAAVTAHLPVAAVPQSAGVTAAGQPVAAVQGTVVQPGNNSEVFVSAGDESGCPPVDVDNAEAAQGWRQLRVCRVQYPWEQLGKIPMLQFAARLGRTKLTHHSPCTNQWIGAHGRVAQAAVHRLAR
jgi:hypothetical protein